MRARVPNFVKANGKPVVDINSNYISSKNLNKAMKDKEQQQATKRMSVAHLAHPASFTSLHQLHQMNNSSLYPLKHHQPAQSMMHQQQYLWHARSHESGIGEYSVVCCSVEWLNYYQFPST